MSPQREASGGDERLGAAADCHRCFNEATAEGSLERLFRRMIVCPTCGNKRCPKATDHRHDCTGSNEPGQAGSVYLAPVLSPVPTGEGTA